MISFSIQEFCSRFLASYFTENFEEMSKENNGGCIDDIDADWNIFVMVNNFNAFVNSLHLEQSTLKGIMEDNFIIPIECMHPDKIQGALKNKQISTIIVNALNASSVPLVQLMFRLFLAQVCGLGEMKYDELNKIISDARIKAGNLAPGYFPRLFQYVLKLCLNQCQTKAFLKVYKILLKQNDLLDEFDDLLEDVYLRISQTKNKSAKKQPVQEKMIVEEQPNNQTVTLKTPTKRKIDKEPKIIKALQFNPKNYIGDKNIAAQSTQKPISIKSNKPSVVQRTIFAITNKKFIPRKTFDNVIDSTKPSPSSRRNKLMEYPTKRAHSSIYYSKDFEQLDDQIDINCLADQTPMLRTKASQIVNTSKKMSSLVPLNFDTSPRKKYKRS